MQPLPNPPILLIIFNRPDLTRCVFDRIRAAQPAQLFVAADGPRHDHPDDVQNCQETRRIITLIDWPCEVKTLFQEKNLGCRVAVGSAITWFFENVEEGIILEDDCLPDSSFFPFCRELLEKHRNATQIMAITGSSFQRDGFECDASYFYSMYPYIWGWATWRRAWKHYQPDPEKYPCLFDSEWLTHQFGSEISAHYWSRVITQCHEKKIITWDYPWIFSIWANQGLGIQPKKNLVTNIGCDHRATNTTSDCAEIFHRPAHAIPFPLQHPPSVTRNKEADRVYEARYLCPEPFTKPPPTLPLNRPLIEKLFSRLRGRPTVETTSPVPDAAELSLKYEFNAYRVHVQAHTMTPVERQLSLYRQAVACEKNNIPGAFVECGTWKGGLVGLMALANLRHGITRRPLHLFDSFEGIPEPDPILDGARAVAEVESVGCHPTGQLKSVSGFYEKFASGIGTLDDNRNLLEKKIGYPQKFLHYHPGWFQDTVPADADTLGPIAILRLDGDWYASTKICLEHLYPKVVPGGYVILDDYGSYDGCRKAVDEFQISNNVRSKLEQIDSSCFVWVKTE